MESIDNKNINDKNRWIDDFLQLRSKNQVYKSDKAPLSACINNISENITKNKSKQIVYKFEDYFIFWN